MPARVTTPALRPRVGRGLWATDERRLTATKWRRLTAEIKREWPCEAGNEGVCRGLERESKILSLINLMAFLPPSQWQPSLLEPPNADGGKQRPSFRLVPCYLPLPIVPFTQLVDNGRRLHCEPFFSARSAGRIAFAEHHWRTGGHRKVSSLRSTDESAWGGSGVSTERERNRQ